MKKFNFYSIKELKCMESKQLLFIHKYFYDYVINLLNCSNVPHTTILLFKSTYFFDYSHYFLHSDLLNRVIDIQSFCVSSISIFVNSSDF